MRLWNGGKFQPTVVNKLLKKIGNLDLNEIFHVTLWAQVLESIVYFHKEHCCGLNQPQWTSALHTPNTSCPP